MAKYKFKNGDLVASKIKNTFVILEKGKMIDRDGNKLDEFGYKVYNLNSKACWWCDLANAHRRWKKVGHSKSAVVLYAK